MPVAAAQAGYVAVRHPVVALAGGPSGRILNPAFTMSENSVNEDCFSATDSRPDNATAIPS